MATVLEWTCKLMIARGYYNFPNLVEFPNCGPIFISSLASCPGLVSALRKVLFGISVLIFSVLLERVIALTCCYILDLCLITYVSNYEY